jgi:hypothetical protein
LLNGDGARQALSRPTARKVLASLKMLLEAAKFAHVAADVSIGRVSRERRLECTWQATVVVVGRDGITSPM